MKSWKKFKVILGRWALKEFARGYSELARIGGQLSDWIMSGVTEDADIWHNIAVLREKSRDAFKENAYLRKFRDELKANVFGAKGITLQMKIKEEADRVVYAPDEQKFLMQLQARNTDLHERGKAVGVELPKRKFYTRVDAKLRAIDGRAKATVKAGQPDVYANNLIENAWREWQRKENCDIAQKRDYRTMRHLRLFQMIRDGGVFIRLYRGKQYNRFGLTTQPINDEWVDHNLNRVAQFEPFTGRQITNEIRLGIERDQFGRVLAYHVIKQRPNAWQYSPQLGGGFGRGLSAYEHERVPAEEMIHYCALDDDAEASRGAPAAASVLLKLRHLDKYEEAEVITARADCCSGGHYHATVPGLDAELLADRIEKNGDKLTDVVEPGRWKPLPFGWQAQAHNPSHPNGNFETFRKGMLRSICSGLPGGAYSRIGSDYESVNYSSSRAEGLNINEMWMLLQEMDIDLAERPIFEAWLEAALAVGAIPLPLEKLGKFNKPTFQGRRWQSIDPLKQAQGDALQIANYQNSRGRQCNERGVDFEEIVEEQAIERIILLEAGLNPEPQIGKTTSPASDETGTTNPPTDEEIQAEPAAKNRLALNGNGH